MNKLTNSKLSTAISGFYPKFAFFVFGLKFPGAKFRIYNCPPYSKNILNKKKIHGQVNEKQFPVPLQSILKKDISQFTLGDFDNLCDLLGFFVKQTPNITDITFERETEIKVMKDTIQSSDIKLDNTLVTIPNSPDHFFFYGIRERNLHDNFFLQDVTSYQNLLSRYQYIPTDLVIIGHGAIAPWAMEDSIKNGVPFSVYGVPAEIIKAFESIPKGHRNKAVAEKVLKYHRKELEYFQDKDLFGYEKLRSRYDLGDDQYGDVLELARLEIAKNSTLRGYRDSDLVIVTDKKNNFIKVAVGALGIGTHGIDLSLKYGQNYNLISGDEPQDIIPNYLRGSGAHILLRTFNILFELSGESLDFYFNVTGCIEQCTFDETACKRFVDLVSEMDSGELKTKQKVFWAAFRKVVEEFEDAPTPENLILTYKLALEAIGHSRTDAVLVLIQERIKSCREFYRILFSSLSSK